MMDKELNGQCDLCTKYFSRTELTEVKEGDTAFQMCYLCANKYRDEQKAKQYQQNLLPLIDFIDNTLNAMGIEQRLAPVFLTEFNKIHRTLQQTFFRFLRDFIERYAKQSDSYFDGRNEASREYSKKISELHSTLFLI